MLFWIRVLACVYVRVEAIRATTLMQTSSVHVLHRCSALLFHITQRVYTSLYLCNWDLNRLSQTLEQQAGQWSVVATKEYLKKKKKKLWKGHLACNTQTKMPQCLFTDCLSRHCILSPVASCFWKLYGLGRSHWTQCGFRKFLLLTTDPASIGSWEENRKGFWEKLCNAVNSKEGAREDDFKISFPSYSPSLHSQVPVSQLLPGSCPSTYGVRISNVKSDFSNSSMLSDCTVEGIKGLAFPSRPLLQI